MQTITSIEVYWDTQDPNNEGWAYRFYSNETLVESGSLDSDDDDIDTAIGDAISISGRDIRTDDFAREPHIDGGFAIWTDPETIH